MFNISRMVDNVSALVYTDEDANIVNFTVLGLALSTSKQLDSAAEIYVWIGDIVNRSAYLTVWFD